MELQKLINELQSKHRGAYMTICYSKTIKGLVKTTITTVRLVDYNSVRPNKNNTEPKPIKTNPNNEYLGNNIIYNKNTKNTLLQVFLTKSPKHRPHSVYNAVDGSEITKEEWYELTGQKQSNPDLMFTINVNDIIYIK